VRLRVAVAGILTATFVIVGATTAAAEAGPPAGGAFGGDQQATGEIRRRGSAEVVARDGGDFGDESQARRGGGNVVCRFYDDATGDPVNPSDLPPEVNGAQVLILRMCDDVTTGEYVSITIITVVPPMVPEVDPRDLAVMARSRLPLPLPAARMSPDGDQTVNLESWLWVENWATQSRSATAGAVTSTVVATPVEQRWTFGSPAERKVCADAGKPYDLSKSPSEQSTTCSYTFRRSSDGQPGDVFQMTVTLVWHVTWTSNIGASGDLGFVPRTTTIPTRVAEHQALNEARSSQ
jgi:hypothetical protein